MDGGGNKFVFYVDFRGEFLSQAKNKNLNIEFYSVFLNFEIKNIRL